MKYTSFHDPEVGRIVKDFSAATGRSHIAATDILVRAKNGDNRILKQYGIDLSGISGSDSRMDFLINELKRKFTAQS